MRSSVHVRTYDKLQNNSFNSDVIVALNASGRWEAAFRALSRVLVFHVRATIESGLTWPLRWSDQNTARLRYAWDFSVLDEFDRVHTVRVAMHTLAVSLGTRSM